MGVKLNGLFSDHMVLQRQKPITVWGTGAGKGPIEVHGGKRACRKWRGEFPGMLV